ncbi:MAG: alpha-E domain-containing protein [Burkholderiales bacterium]|nr:alpha-E domain-containing protein [Burkholderiales bacterium]
MLSRTANHLYWMARYVERAENTARILEVTYRMSLMPQAPELVTQEWFAPLNITGTLFPFTGRYSEVGAREVLRYMVLDQDNPSSIYSCAKAARENARAVRGSITSEMWEVLNSTWLELQRMNEARVDSAGIVQFFDWVKERSHLFRGATSGTALRDQAIQFNRLGTFLERADNTARILDVKYHVLLPKVEDVGGAVDYYQWAAVLQSVSGFESYRKVYRDVITPLRVAELMILREDMPRSLHACMAEAYNILRGIATSQSAEAVRLAGELHAGLHFNRIETIFSAGLHEYLTDFLTRTSTLGSEINRGFFTV